MSTQTAKNAAISAHILAYVANGATLREAINWVLGPAHYECLVEELYEGLRAKACTCRDTDSEHRLSCPLAA